MRPALAGVLLATLWGAANSPAQVYVPADYPTIQAAINSGAALVYVSDGAYAEVLTVNRTLTLLPAPPADPYQPTPFPRVSGLQVTRNTVDDPVVYVRGFHFSGPVTQTNAYTPRHGITTLEGCRLDGGFWTYGNSGTQDAIKIRSCVITGDVYVYAYHNEFTGNVVWKGKAQVHSNGGNGALIRDNLVIGPSADGVISSSVDANGSILRNTVTGVSTGVALARGTASDNVVTDCPVAGFTEAAGTVGGSRVFSGNEARNCGVGYRFSVNGATTVTGCTAESSATYGIHATSTTSMTVTQNHVLESGSGGIRLEGGGEPVANHVLGSGNVGISCTGRASSNIVGRSGSHGIVGRAAARNTVYGNGGSGLLMTPAIGDSIHHNILYGNTSYGLDLSALRDTYIGCNDYFLNLAPVHGAPIGASDLQVDPQFCGVGADIVYLRSSSPLLLVHGCGLVGALGMACGPAAGVEPSATVERFTAAPNPVRESLELRWGGTTAASRIEFFDVRGALRRLVELPAGSRSYRWDGRDQHAHSLPGGVYYARWTSGGRSERVRVVLVR
ncbi:MAG: right-handed parallel beta-helix repeat-containing protein [Candidatus Eisenbacteria bacterium]